MARKQPSVVLCATLTADGKLMEEDTALAQVLLQGGASSGRHFWAAEFDRAGAVIVDEKLAAARALEQRTTGPLLVVASGRTLDAELAKLRVARMGGPTWCFGGGEWCRALLEAVWVDELFLCVRPRIDGRRGLASLSGIGGEFFSQSVACRLVKTEVAGDQCFLRYRVVKGRQTERKAD